jgi:small multidrug resistance pump
MASDNETMQRVDRHGIVDHERHVTAAMTYLYLAIAIVFEVIATSSLKSSEGFTRILPSLVSVIGYLVTFYFLALTLRTMPIGIAYAIWSGVGILLLAAIDWVWFRQTLDLPAIIGLCLIILGVVTINVFSKTLQH